VSALHPPNSIGWICGSFEARADAEGQTDVIDAFGREKVFVDHASGMLATRLALIEAPCYIRRGVSVASDDAVVVRA